MQQSDICPVVVQQSDVPPVVVQQSDVSPVAQQLSYFCLFLKLQSDVCSAVW